MPFLKGLAIAMIYYIGIFFGLQQTTHFLLPRLRPNGTPTNCQHAPSGSLWIPQPALPSPFVPQFLHTATPNVQTDASDKGVFLYAVLLIENENNNRAEGTTDSISI